MKIHSIILGLVIAGISGACLAQWQWLDKDGRKVFSDRHPPSDVPEKNILKRPAGPSQASSAAAAVEAANDELPAGAASPPPASSIAGNRPVPTGLDKELEAKKKQAAEAEAAKRKAADDALAKQKIENCTRAKQAKATLDSGVRLSRTNAAGEPEVMDDAARAAEGRRVQGLIASECK